MNRQKLVEILAYRHNISKAMADRLLVSVFAEIMQAVARGDDVTLIGFGTFKRVESAPRSGRNPNTGEHIVIPATRKPRFVVGSFFREIVNSGDVPPETKIPDDYQWPRPGRGRQGTDE